MHTQPPQIMGIINITPDSFSDGGQFISTDRAVLHGIALHEEGADILDIGGESTRPGAEHVSLQEELDRVIPAIEALSKAVDVPISIDTYKPEVMCEAVKAGASIINDIYALRQPGALKAAKSCNVTICLMHMQGEPGSMQANPRYDNVVQAVYDFLSDRVQACIEAGIKKDQLIIDPGFGFGKNAQHNLSLLNHLEAFQALNLPVLVGLSRKSLIGKVLGRDVDERLPASLALASLAVTKKSTIIRTHDVKATKDAVQMIHAVITETAE